jgi:hypothetical protein
MKGSTRDLTGRHEMLVRRCGAEREQAARYANELRAAAADADRRIARLKRWLFHPAALAAGLALLVVLGRSRSLRVMGTALGLMAPILRAAGWRAVASRSSRRPRRAADA